MVTSPYSSGKNGRGEKIRTSDPLLPKQVRYQAALRPDTEDVFYITRLGDLARFFSPYWAGFSARYCSNCFLSWAQR